MEYQDKYDKLVKLLTEDFEIDGKNFNLKEDFEKFSEGLHEVLAKIDELRQSGEFESSVDSAAYSEVEFDDLA